MQATYTQDRLALQHSTDCATGDWYTVSKVLFQPYLLCLLRASDLRERYSIEAIPHYSDSPAKVYNALLQGTILSPILKSKQPQAIMDAEFPELEDQHVDPPPPIADIDEEFDEDEIQQEQLQE